MGDHFRASEPYAKIANTSDADTFPSNPRAGGTHLQRFCHLFGLASITTGMELKSQLSTRKKVVFAILATVIFLLLCETILCLLPEKLMSSPVENRDPFVGFDSVPLLLQQKDVDGRLIAKTNPDKLIWFNEQQFPIEKSKHTVRVACVGGSTTYGRPFDDHTSFVGYLRELLPVMAPEANWEVINAGGISYASYRVAAVMEELSQYEVDFFVVYTGQNEFLEWRTYGKLMDGPSAIDRAGSITQAIAHRKLD